MPEDIIRVKGLTRTFGKVEALKGLDLTVKEGEYFGFLGPNGAGKSTAIRIMTTLLRPTTGEVTVLGHDVVKEPEGVRRSIGLVSDKVALYPHLTTRENLRFFGRLYGVPVATVEARAQELLKVTNMEQWADARVAKFSTGMRQRVNIARALITQPRVLFLDEPTLGLDPQSTREIRDFTRTLNKERGMTIVLTTHQMGEADLLCDRIGVVDHGKLIACDTSRALKEKVLAKSTRAVEVECAYGAADIARVAKERGLVKGAELSDPFVRLLVQDGDLDALLDIVRAHGKGVRNVRTNEPTLEDVFLELTGRELRGGPSAKRGALPLWVRALVKGAQVKGAIQRKLKRAPEVKK
ncbi:MAG TPA: ABC transporter ATP-binding protein [Candidatus Thermoplasmatota archaeon]|nr:ABC transporter ATP-binding protein [Candidatus Thermoplasmatota archaeon]